MPSSSPSPFLRLSRRPAAVALRLLLWPTAILGLAQLAARTEDDGLAAGLTGLAVSVATSFVLALADGLVLRTRALVVVWSVTTLVVVALVVAQPLVDFVVHGSQGDTWAELVAITLDELPSSAAFGLVFVGVPVALGAVAGAALRRSVRPSGGGRHTPSPRLSSPGL